MKDIILLLLLPFLAFSQNQPASSIGRGASPLEIKAAQFTSGATYAVVVGISDYQDKDIPDLRFADKDAEAFANYLRSPAGGALDDDHLQVLTNTQATAGRIAEALDALIEKAKKDDQVIIYFSGHGDVEGKKLTQPGFLLCWDAPSRVYMGGGTYSLSFLQEVVSTLSVQNQAKVVVITDACHAGKLAGSQIGGAQLTTANLAKQYANEVKILSCQPNEFSLEGEQWGGGRGVFSYHLVDGLFGLADRNNDGHVSLGEIDRYLEDHVTVEAAPQSQVPILLGNKTDKLANVNSNVLAELKKNKTGNMAVFAATESRGLEDDVLSKLDSNIIRKYFAFKKAVVEKRFLEPENDCAELFYTSLSTEPGLAPLQGFMKRNYAAALQDDAQQVINAILKSDINEHVFSNMISKAEQYNLYPRNLDRAADLLGSQHYMYKSLKARKSFFEGFSLAALHTKEGTIGGINDKSIIPKVMDYYRQALSWQSDLSYVYFNISTAYGLGLKQLDSAEYYMQLAIKSTPTWLLAYTTLSEIYLKNNSPKSRLILEQANSLDSNSAILLYKWGEYYNSINDYQNAERKLIQLVNRKDLGLCVPCIHNALGIAYINSDRLDEAEKEYLLAAQIDSTLDPVYSNLFGIYIAAERYYDAEVMLHKQMRIHPFDVRTYIMQGDWYRINKQFEKSDSNYRLAIQMDSTDARLFYWSAVCNLNLNRFKEAETMLIAGVRHFPKTPDFPLLLGQAYVQLNRFDESEKQFKQAISLDSNSFYLHSQLGTFYAQLRRYEESARQFRKAIQLNPKFNLGYYNLSCVLSMLNNTDEAFQQLELAFQNGFDEFEDIQKDTDLQNLKLQEEKWNQLLKKYFPDKMK